MELRVKAGRLHGQGGGWCALGFHCGLSPTCLVERSGCAWVFCSQVALAWGTFCPADLSLHLPSLPSCFIIAIILSLWGQFISVHSGAEGTVGAEQGWGIPHRCPPRSLVPSSHPHLQGPDSTSQSWRRGGGGLSSFRLSSLRGNSNNAS